MHDRLLFSHLRSLSGVMPFRCGKRSAGICVVRGPKNSSNVFQQIRLSFFEPAALYPPALLSIATKDYSDSS